MLDLQSFQSLTFKNFFFNAYEVHKETEIWNQMLDAQISHHETSFKVQL